MQLFIYNFITNIVDVKLYCFYRIICSVLGETICGGLQTSINRSLCQGTVAGLPQAIGYIYFHEDCV